MEKYQASKKLILAVIFLAGILILQCLPAFADSRSKTIQVSCTIVPMIEMSQTASFQARSNLGNRYLSSDSLVDRQGQRVRLISVTAL